MLLKNKNNIKILIIILYLITILSIFIYMDYSFTNLFPNLFTTVNCDLDFEGLVNHIINGIMNLNLDDLMVMLSNLEFLQNLVGVPQNGYDIGLNNTALFFELLFQHNNLSVELIDGVYLNVIFVENTPYTVHPDLIDFLISLFLVLEFIFF